MKKLALVRGRNLNLWDIGNYYGLTKAGVELYVCGHNYGVDWDGILYHYPLANPVIYRVESEVLSMDFDVIDLPDAHYPETGWFAERHERCVAVGWDNLPGKNLSKPARTALKKSWKVAARSKMAAHCLHHFDGVPKSKIDVIYGAVDTDYFKPPEKRGNDKIVLFVGRLTIEKGLLALLWAMKTVEAELWIAGSGNREFFEHWISVLNIKDRVRWLDFLSRKELRDAYHQASVLCVPSQVKFESDPFASWSEQFGQVFIEAMACGLPVITTMTGAIPEVCGEAARYVPAGSYHKLAEALTSTLEAEKKLYDIMSEVARDIAVRHFDTRQRAEQIIDWYELG